MVDKYTWTTDDTDQWTIDNIEQWISSLTRVYGIKYYFLTVDGELYFVTNNGDVYYTTH